MKKLFGLLILLLSRPVLGQISMPNLPPATAPLACSELVPMIQPGNSSGLAVNATPAQIAACGTGGGGSGGGGSGVGGIDNPQLVAIANHSLSGLPFIDGINGVAGKVVLLTQQTTTSQNGFWVMGSSSWTRPTWWASGSTVPWTLPCVRVAEGLQYAGTEWCMPFTAAPVIVDTTTVNFYRNPSASLASGSSNIRLLDQRAADVANPLDYETWGGAIRYNYGNNSSFGGIGCTSGSSSISLAGLTIPLSIATNGAPSYATASAEIDGCGNPGAANSTNPGSNASFVSFTANGSGYWPHQLLQVSGGTSTIPAIVVVYSTTVSAIPTLVSAGSGCTNGTQVFTGTTGVSGTTGANAFFTISTTVASGSISSINSYTANGPYWVNPNNVNVEPVSGGGCSTAPTVALSMGANTYSVFQSGNYTAIPSNPVSFTSASQVISSLSWSSNTVTVGTQSPESAAVLVPGWQFPGWSSGATSFPVTISGAPGSYNGTYTATVTGTNTNGQITFTYPLSTSQSSCSSSCGTFTVAPSAASAAATMSWYGNPLLCSSISNVVNAGGNTSFTCSTAAGSTLSTGPGKVYLWNSTDNSGFTGAIGSGRQNILLGNPPTVPGWESGYMISSGLSLGAAHRWDFNCAGGFISGAVNVGSPVSGGLITAASSAGFRAQGGSVIEHCDLDAAGGFQRDFTMGDWDWLVHDNYFENATSVNIGWSLGGHSRESLLVDFMIINQGYNPLTLPILNIDTEANDTRIKHGLVEGAQGCAVYSGGFGDVHFDDIHAYGSVAAPSFCEAGNNNFWTANLADGPPPGMPGFRATQGDNFFLDDNVQADSYWGGQDGILLTSSAHHNHIQDGQMGGGNMPGGTPGSAYGCVDQTSLADNIIDPVPWGCSYGNVLDYPKLNGVLPSLVSGNGNCAITGSFPNQTITCTTGGSGDVTSSGSPTSGQFAEWSSSVSITGETMGGDCTLSTATITCTKTSGTAFGTFATQNYATPPSIGGTTPAAGSFTTLSATGNLTTNVTGSIQCVQANSSGVLSGTGVACGSGGSGSGTVNSAAAGDIAYYASTGTAVSGATLGGNLQLSGTVLQTAQPENPQTGTTYTVASTDAGKLITFCNSSAVAVTLPQAGTTGFTYGFSIDVQNKLDNATNCPNGTGGTVTITPTTSKINNQISLALPLNYGCTISADNTGQWQVSACDALGVYTTGSPASGNLTFFSGSSSITNGNLTGDVVTLGSGATTVEKIQNGTIPVNANVLSTNSSEQLIAAVNTNVIALWTGTCSSTTFLRGDGQCTAPSGSGTVNTGTSGNLAYYATSTNAVSSASDTSLNAGGLTLGVANSVIGTLTLEGSSSGAITIQPQAAAGTYDFNLPTTAGSSGNLLASGGGSSSAMTWDTTTGSGTVVALATSPVFTTPNLGTPSALTLTNATGLPCGAMPALTGDATSAAASCATTVGKLNGGTVPTSAGMLSANSSGQIVAQAAVAATLSSGTTYDYSPTGFGNTTAVLYLTPASGGSTLGGLAAQNGLQQVYIVNAEAAGGADSIYLLNQSSSDSTAANRFLTSATNELGIIPGGRVLCIYLPSTVSRWSCQ